MRFILALFMTAASYAATNEMVVNSPAGETNRPTTLSRVFKQAEFASGTYPRPSIGTPLTEWQTNVISTWPDGSVKQALVHFVYTFPAGNTTVSFVSSANPSHSGNLATSNAAALSQAQMLAYTISSAAWNFQWEATAGGVTKEADVRTMLTAGDWSYWLRGPIVTVVLVEGQQSTGTLFNHDFGWKWDGTTMEDCEDGGATCTLAASNYRSIHPQFILTFWHGLEKVKGESILENVWLGKRQDQYISLALKTGATASTTRFSTPNNAYVPVLSYSGNTTLITINTDGPHGLSTGDIVSVNNAQKTNACTSKGTHKITVVDSDTFTYPGRHGCLAGTVLTVRPALISPGVRYRKTYWEGAEPAYLYVSDWNLPYMKETRIVPNYDPAITISSSTLTAARTTWNTYDKGEIGGVTYQRKTWDGDEEAAPLGTRDTQCLYNAHAECGRMEVGADGTISGGGGDYAISNHAPVHWREDSSGFYRDSDNNGTTDTDVAQGRAVSIDFRPTVYVLQFSDPVGSDSGGGPTPVGIGTMGGFALDAAHDHHLAFAAALKYGDLFWFQEMNYWVAWKLGYNNPSQTYTTGRWRSRGYCMTGTTREWGSCIRHMSQALMLLPDAWSAERLYIDQKLQNNIKMREGRYDVRTGIGFPSGGIGSTCVINSAGTGCTSGVYSATSETNHWIWGRMTSGSAKPNPLKWFQPGVVTGAHSSYKDAGYYADSEWMVDQNYQFIGYALDYGFTDLNELFKALSYNRIVRILHPDYNPNLMSMYVLCNYVTATALPIATWAEAKSCVAEPYESATTLSWCAQNGSSPSTYCIRGLQSLAYMRRYSHACAECPGGVASGEAAHAWAASRINIAATVGQDARYATVPLEVTGGAFTILTTSVPNISSGVAYSTTLVASGGTPPASNWQVIDGTLPSGITLNTSGLLAGTTTDTPGDYVITVQAQDSAGSPVTDTQELTVTLVNPNPPSLSPSGVHSLTLGGSCGPNLTATGGAGSNVFSTVSGTLPSGCSLNTSNGQITGTVVAVGDFTMRFRVTDSGAATANTDIVLRVEPTGLNDLEMSAIAVDTSAIIAWRRVGLDANQTCTAIVRNVSSREIEGIATLSSGAARRTAVIAGLVQDTPYEGQVGCGSLGGSVLFTTSAALSGNASWAATLVPPAILGAVDSVLVEYGTTTSLGSSATPACTAGACPVSLTLTKGLYYIRWRYRVAGTPVTPAFAPFAIIIQ